MEITTIHENDQVRIMLRGAMNEGNTAKLTDHLLNLKLEHTSRLELDFADVSRIGGSGIGKILCLYQALTNKGAKLAVTNLPDPIFSLFNELRLDTLFLVAGKEYEA